MASILQHLLLLVAIAAAAAKSQTLPIAKPGCPQSCGNLSIPYPFGTVEGCYFDENFLITCDNTTNTLYLGVSNIDVLSISLNGQVRINGSLSTDCYNELGLNSFYDETWVTLRNFSVSSSLNKLIAIGCDTVTTITGFTDPTGWRYDTGCNSYCYSNESLVNGSCSGTGCCEVSIPRGAYGYNISLSSYSNHSKVIDYNPCSYAFVVEDGFYNFSTADLAEFHIETFPVVVEWTIGGVSCDEAKGNLSGYACKSPNSECFDSATRSGYLCNCSAGFHGNPYLSNGCQDIDECADPLLNDCVSLHNCQNLAGSYTCNCLEGYVGDGRKSGERCTRKNKQSLELIISVGVSVPISAILVVILLLIFLIRKKELMKQRENNFKENGGLMLKQLLSKVEQSEEKAKIFTEDELNKATNKFDDSQIIGQGGYGTVYKGTLENKTVAIKKSKVMDRDQTEQFVNEVIVLSTIRHPSVVRLLGCCLETPVPLLVYEFITNNTLHHHLHQRNKRSSMGWETRMNIAVQTADALAYMHSDAPIHIIHRDVKSANILLDDTFQAKVSDFGVSRLVALDQTQLATVVQGTFGYMDPEYFTSGLLTDKSDVYSFGIVLVELLTGQNVICPDRPEKEKYLSALFISAMKDDKLDEIIDRRVKYEGDPKQLEGFANIARRCISMTGEKRPTMKEVKRELEVLRIYKRSDVEAVIADLEEEEPLLGVNTETRSALFDSTKCQAPMELESGR